MDRQPPHDRAEAPSRLSPRLKKLGIVLLVLIIAALFCGQAFIGSAIESRMDANLSKRGWTLQRTGASWNLWRGLTMEQVKLGREGQPPVLEADNLSIKVPFTGGHGLAITSHRSPLLLRDEKGEIRLDEVTVELVTTDEGLRADRIKARKDGLLVEVKGTIRVVPGGDRSQWTPRFDAVRGTLAALKMEGEVFRVGGSFLVDVKDDIAWNADLSGRGGEVVWQGLPLKSAEARAALSSGTSSIAANLALPRGVADFEVTRDDWESSPFQFEGSITDQADHTNDFTGSYQPGQKVWNLKRLDGQADLLSIAREVPMFADKVPAKMAFKVFPYVDLRDATMKVGQTLQIGSLAISGGVTSFQLEGRRIEVRNLAGTASYNGKSWRIRRSSASLFGGKLAMSGSYQDGTLSGASVSGEGLKLAAIKTVSGRKGNSNGVLSFSYKGKLDLDGKTAEGQGKMRLDNAPVIDVPLLDQTYDLFTSMIPGIERGKTGTFSADFVARSKVIDVPRFEATGGTLTVSAKGRVDLARERVDGVARGKLNGLPGVVTKPLSRLLEMEVGGPYDDIRVKPMGPAKLVSNAASSTVGVPVDTIEEAGRITGAVLAEGIKVPLKWFDRDDAGHE
ncbi:AsmA-like C-terminal region-containing protein [Luteolibacter sp. GHJ8]|uniref:AsmA-like C-terminal region-containing protein n=1 Tax=Luteolibacter rhizosphaerae TaxID=2989719 RepID=A0ABT3FWX7_9BACT|nr:AsmA-like C-terminal region-containing protein [Luteolibacter rhizosphaerae]MCW1912097.1 AsmA-like C-terminal region-containing protein [Luteolibacter rhizosphaerae]